MKKSRNNDALEDASRKPLVIKDDGTFTLYRKTRAGTPNVNGIIYTKEALDAAMKRYIETNGMVFLAPAVIDSGYDVTTMKRINTDIYMNFYDYSKGQNIEYSIGRIYSWDDFTVTCKYTPTSTTKELTNMILENSKINLRYLATVVKGKPIEEMRILCLDIPCIPFDVLGVDMSKYKYK